MRMRVFGCLVSCAAACVSLAQPADEQPAEPGGHAPRGTPGLLAGPEVDHDRPALLEEGLTMQMAPMMAQRRQLPQRDVVKLLDQLRHESVSPGLRISPEQDRALRAIGREHRSAVAAYRAEHKGLYDALRAQAGYGVPGPTPEPTPDQAIARQKLRELNARGPTNAQLQAKLFAALTGPQQDWLDERIADVLARREREAGEKRYRNELNAPAPKLEDFLDEDGAVDLTKVPARLERRLRRLAPERRLVALRRLIERADGPAGAGRDGRDRPE